MKRVYRGIKRGTK